MARYSEVDLAAIMAELDESVPYYVPGLIEEIRHLRKELMRARARIESVEASCPVTILLDDAVAIINGALEGRS